MMKVKYVHISFVERNQTRKNMTTRVASIYLRMWFLTEVSFKGKIFPLKGQPLTVHSKLFAINF